MIYDLSATTVLPSSGGKFIVVIPVHSVAIRSPCCRICDVNRWKRLDPESFGMRRVEGKESISSIL